MTRQPHQSTPCQLRGVRRYVLQTLFRGRADRVRSTAGDRVMERSTNQRSPGGLENGAAITCPRESRQRHQRLRQTLEPKLDLPVPALERRPRAVHTLQCPGVVVRPAQLTGEWLHGSAVRCLKELVQSRDAERARGLEVGEQIAQPGERGVW